MADAENMTQTDEKYNAKTMQDLKGNPPSAVIRIFILELAYV
ncbi:MAG TPA: hypothetical protein VFB72_11355 [Verrucomicrobiae bacterium]|nr:hypothetical protein [Verrucomicrobiae bacterium]